MKKLLAAIALSLGLIFSAEAQCHGAAAVIGDHIDGDHAKLHIYAVMQCDDGRQMEFRSREGVITSETPRQEVAKLIVAMANETVDYFAAAGCPSDVEDLIKHLGFKDDESEVKPANPLKLKYAPPIPHKTYLPLGPDDDTLIPWL